MYARRYGVLFLLVLALLGLLPSAAPAHAAPLAAPPAGWVKAEVVGGGCDSAGHCNSDVTPGSPTLYEYKPDRTPVERDRRVTTDLSQHGGYPTFVEREMCHIGSVDYYWSAGFWHHGGFWTLTYDSRGRETWSGPSRQHWAFEHGDVCEPLPTTIPTLTSTPPPPPPPGAPTFTPVPTDAPTPTEPPPSLCVGSAGAFDQRSNLKITVPHVPAVEYAWNTPVNANGDLIGQVYPPSFTSLPPYPLPLARVRPNQPLTFAYDFASLQAGAVNAQAYEADHNGQARVLFGLRDLTSGQNLITVDTEDVKGLADSGGQVIIWGRTLHLRSVTVAAGVTFRGPMWFAAFDRLHGGAWNPRDVTPRTNWYIPTLGSAQVTFTPQPDHTYAVWSWAGHGACQIEAPRWTVAQFSATDRLIETVTATPGVGVPTATPTLTPTPQPPRPPVPNAAFSISIHSTLDPNSQDADPRNGVYRSMGNRIAWPAGEVLDFTPRVRMTLSPPAPSYPGYRFQAHVESWSYRSSVGQNAASAADGMGRAGCRGGGTPTTGSDGAAACRYAYIGGASLSDTTEPNEADMASQAHVYWAVGAPQRMRPDVYVYRLDQLQGVDLVLDVRIVVEVVNVASGRVVASDTRAVSGTFAVTLVVPRSAK